MCIRDSIGFLAGYNAWVNRELTPEEDAAQVAIVYNDNDGNSQSITKGEVQDAYTEAATMYQMNYGTTSGYESQILNEALSAAISDRIVPLKAQEMCIRDRGMGAPESMLPNSRSISARFRSFISLWMRSTSVSYTHLAIGVAFDFVIRFGIGKKY